jgi:TPR repeat protein
MNAYCRPHTFIAAVMFLVIALLRAGSIGCAFGAQKVTTHTPKDWLALAEAGDKTAQAYQCAVFSFLDPKPVFFQKAVSWCRRDAENGNAHMERLLSRIYAQGGGGIARDIAESYFWLAISVNNDATARASREAVKRHLNSKQLAEADSRIENWKKKFCANRKNGAALKKFHCYGTEKPKENAAPIEFARDAFKGRDYRKAFELSLPLAEKGNAEAQFMVGNIYNGNQAGNLDWTKAAEWYRKSAEQGYAPAEFYLGQMLDNGIQTKGPSAGKGVAKNTKEALSWYHKAAEQKYVDAYAKLALAFYNGVDVPKNLAEAFAWQYLSLETHLREGERAYADMDRMFLANISDKLSAQERPAAKRRAAELKRAYLP